MAKPDDKDKKEIVVDPKTLDSSASVIDEWGRYLNTLLPPLREPHTINAGNFPEAMEFSTHGNANIKTLVTGVGTSNDTLINWATDLRDTAGIYRAGERDSEHDAERVKTFVTDAGGSVPGAAGAVPQPQPTSSTTLPSQDD